MLHLTQRSSGSGILVEARQRKQRVTKIFFLCLVAAVSLHIVPLLLFRIDSHPIADVSQKNILLLSEVSQNTTLPLKKWSEPLPYPTFLP